MEKVVERPADDPSSNKDVDDVKLWCEALNLTPSQFFSTPEEELKLRLKNLKGQLRLNVAKHLIAYQKEKMEDLERKNAALTKAQSKGQAQPSIASETQAHQRVPNQVVRQRVMPSQEMRFVVGAMNRPQQQAPQQLPVNKNVGAKKLGVLQSHPVSAKAYAQGLQRTRGGGNKPGGGNILDIFCMAEEEMEQEYLDLERAPLDESNESFPYNTTPPECWGDMSVGVRGVDEYPMMDDSITQEQFQPHPYLQSTPVRPTPGYGMSHGVRYGTTYSRVESDDSLEVTDTSMTIEDGPDESVVRVSSRSYITDKSGGSSFDYSGSSGSSYDRSCGDQTFNQTYDYGPSNQACEYAPANQTFGYGGANQTFDYGAADRTFDYRSSSPCPANRTFSGSPRTPTRSLNRTYNGSPYGSLNQTYATQSSSCPRGAPDLSRTFPSSRSPNRSFNTSGGINRSYNATSSCPRPSSSPGGTRQAASPTRFFPTGCKGNRSFGR